MRFLDFLRRGHLFKTRKPIPTISLETRFDYYQTFASPSPDLHSKIINANGEEVGYVTYAVSPLYDKVYIYDFKLKEQHMRRGYGSAFLVYLHDTYRLPITPIHQLSASDSFWDSFKRIARDGPQVTEPISMGDMATEMTAWSHLEPQKELLKRTIANRLQTEEWYQATGRGLD